ncbi:MAG TPA: response regulator [Coriobacteriia bacterium]
MDDSLTVRMDIAEALQSAGFDTVLCADLRCARETLAHEGSDLVVLDILLPDGDGLDFLKELRSSSATAHIPVLLLSTEAEVKNRVRGMGAGANEYIGKPYDLGQVVARARTLTQADASSGVGSGRRVLAVDDSITYLQELASQLRQDGYDVVLATSGEEALELLAAQAPDCILLDLVMPGLSGQDTCRRIKQRAEWRDIPLLMLTARDDRDAMIEGINAGADDYIAKSADFDVLKARLRAQLRRKHFEDENRRIREKLVRSETEATARKQAEAEQNKLDQLLRDQQFYTRSLIESNIDAIMTTDPRGIITDVNKQMGVLTGCTRDELIGAPFKNFFTDRESAEASIKLALSERKVINYELTARARDGKETVVSYNATTFYDREGTLQGVFAAARDVTERKRLDQVLREKNIELENSKSVAEKANLAKSEFLSSMSHELRSPLNAILGFAQLMDSDSPRPTAGQKASIDQILQAGWYLLDLINEVLNLAQIESGKVSLSRESTSLAEVLLECQDMVAPQALKHGITTTFPKLDVPLLVDADRTRLKQVLINLLSNAIKYNRTGGTVTVDCTVRANKRIRIAVTDTGAGLSPDQLAQLFQPFNRLGQEAGGEEGTGIGLVVSKRLIELMDGVIGVESAVGVGSLFWIELLPATAVDGDGAPAEPSEQPRPELPDGARLRTLLYVEDNPANLKLVEQLIARRPELRLLSAADASLGIQIARTSLPDMILMDINLPGISGVEALKVLREDPATSHIPVVALSANAMPGDIEKGLDVGFFRYLTKPIKVRQFMDTLNAALDFADEEPRQRK